MSQAARAFNAMMGFDNPPEPKESRSYKNSMWWSDYTDKAKDDLCEDQIKNDFINLLESKHKKGSVEWVAEVVRLVTKYEDKIEANAELRGAELDDEYHASFYEDRS